MSLKRLTKISGLLVAILFVSCTMVVLGALPSGDWNIDGSGHIGKLSITSVDARGNLKGTLTMGNRNPSQIFGFWDDTSKEISFVEIVDPRYPDAIQIYTGYYWVTAVGADQKHTLAGSCKSFAAAGGSAQRSVYGWYAQKTTVG